MSQFYSTKQEIKNWLDQHDIQFYHINDDLTVDVDSDVYLSDCDLKYLPVQFGKVLGYFNCEMNCLTDLTGSPRVVNGSFYCGSNYIENLEGAPLEIGKDFASSYNEYDSLDGITEKIGGRFICDKFSQEEYLSHLRKIEADDLNQTILQHLDGKQTVTKKTNDFNKSDVEN